MRDVSLRLVHHEGTEVRLIPFDGGLDVIRRAIRLLHDQPDPLTVVHQVAEHLGQTDRRVHEVGERIAALIVPFGARQAPRASELLARIGRLGCRARSIGAAARIRRPATGGNHRDNRRQRGARNPAPSFNRHRHPSVGMREVKYRTGVADGSRPDTEAGTADDTMQRAARSASTDRTEEMA